MVDTDLLAVKKITLNLVTYISEHCQHQVNKWLLLNRLHFIQPPMRRMLVLAWMMAETLWKDVRRLVGMTVDTFCTYTQYTYINIIFIVESDGSLRHRYLVYSIILYTYSTFRRKPSSVWALTGRLTDRPTKW